MWTLWTANNGWIIIFSLVWFYKGIAKSIQLWQNSRYRSYSTLLSLYIKYWTVWLWSMTFLCHHIHQLQTFKNIRFYWTTLCMSVCLYVCLYVFCDGPGSRTMLYRPRWLYLRAVDSRRTTHCTLHISPTTDLQRHSIEGVLVHRPVWTIYDQYCEPG